VYVTDEALTAQTVEMPCIPLAEAFPTLDVALVFAVDVTEMAKLGPEQYRLPDVKSDQIALSASRSQTCT
jgi:hypothetical protein